MAFGTFYTSSSGDLRGGRKRPSSAAENQVAGNRIDTPPGLHRPRAPRAAPWNLHQDADRPIPLADRNSTRPIRCRGPQKVRAANCIQRQ